MKDIQLVNFTDSEIESTAYLTFLTNNGFVNGQDFLLQKIVKRILTTKGSNGLSPSVGSTFYKLLGGVDTYDTDVIKTYLNISVKELVNDIILEQESLEDDDAVLTDDEKLIDMVIYSIDFNTVTNSWILILDVITESNKVLKLQVPLTL